MSTLFFNSVADVANWLVEIEKVENKGLVEQLSVWTLA